MNMNDDLTDQILNNTTCFKEHQKYKKACNKESCRHWISSERFQNCSILAANKGPLTLQEIGDIFGVTRMRICQIEKTVIKKLSNKSKIVDTCYD